MYRSRIRRNRPSAVDHAGTHNIRKNRHVVNGTSCIMVPRLPSGDRPEVTRRKNLLTSLRPLCYMLRDFPYGYTMCEFQCNTAGRPLCGIFLV